MCFKALKRHVEQLVVSIAAVDSGPRDVSEPRWGGPVWPCVALDDPG